jgi:hypothetical protein
MRSLKAYVCGRVDCQKSQRCELAGSLFTQIFMLYSYAHAIAHIVRHRVTGSHWSLKSLFGSNIARVQAVQIPNATETNINNSHHRTDQGVFKSHSSESWDACYLLADHLI